MKLDSEKNATLEINLIADSGYQSHEKDIRISADQWRDIQQIIHNPVTVIKNTEYEELQLLKTLSNAAQELNDTFLKQVNYGASSLSAEGISALNEFGIALNNVRNKKENEPEPSECTP